jgi:hypothetical protein
MSHVIKCLQQQRSFNVLIITQDMITVHKLVDSIVIRREVYLLLLSEPCHGTDFCACAVSAGLLAILSQVSR